MDESLSPSSLEKLSGAMNPPARHREAEHISHQRFCLWNKSSQYLPLSVFPHTHLANNNQPSCSFLLHRLLRPRKRANMPLPNPNQNLRQAPERRDIYICGCVCRVTMWEGYEREYNHEAGGGRKRWYTVSDRSRWGIVWGGEKSKHWWKSKSVVRVWLIKIEKLFGPVFA